MEMYGLIFRTLDKSAFLYAIHYIVQLNKLLAVKILPLLQVTIYKICTAGTLCEVRLIKEPSPPLRSLTCFTQE